MYGNTKFRKCWDVVKLIFTLSHGQAAVERGFSVSKELLVENLHGQAAVERGFSVSKELLVENLQQISLVSQRIVGN